MSVQADPAGHMGVYQCLDDVPDRRRFHQYEDIYEGRDTWGDYLDEHLFERVTGERGREDARRAEERWKSHMKQGGRHHALATPTDVEDFASELVEDYAIRTAYGKWIFIEKFYDWLLWHTDHPHMYHPFLIAAAEYSASGEIWEFKATRWKS